MTPTDFITRNEYQNAMERIHTRIDEIRESSIRNEETVKKIEVYGNKIYSIMYGNGQDGLIVKLSKFWQAVNFNRWLIGLMIIGLLGMCWRVLTP